MHMNTKYVDYEHLIMGGMNTRRIGMNTKFAQTVIYYNAMIPQILTFKGKTWLLKLKLMCNQWEFEF